MSQSSSTGDVKQPTIVFVHGFLDDGDTWNDVAAGLPWGSARVELGDVPSPTLDAFAEHVTDFVDNKVVGDVVLVGQSMGSQVAELVTVRRPDRVAGLVLVAPVPLGGVSLPAEMADALRNCGGQLELQRGIRTQLSADLPEDKMLRLLYSGMQLTSDQVAATFDAWSSGHPEGTGPTRVGAPVQIIVADSDPVVRGQLLDELILPRFAGAPVATITSSGHWPHVEQPAQVTDVIFRFVASAVR
ncbi:MAG: alpha/beta hydrolase fold protein [Amycolatopsis sp.]|uniref:alpha/beta fold hydrolase n=1 Tax=Amycolatopsis sp. TaxID=37632 RepID=UPI0026333F49|nr:alpha/beta hydrolase [Amycolatopsis sp.]MCU1681943.1 alpha/beta hydrolase fold protein [Amycolatopsis sp.]